MISDIKRYFDVPHFRVDIFNTELCEHVAGLLVSTSRYERAKAVRRKEQEKEECERGKGLGDHIRRCRAMRYINSVWRWFPKW